MSPIPLRAYIYGALILAAVIGVGIWHHLAVLEGVRKEHAKELAALAVQQKKDETNATDTITGLQSDLAKARGLANLHEQPPDTGPRVQLRYIAGSCETPAAPSGSEPGPAASGSVPSLRDGDRAGPDPIHSMRELAEAAEVVAAEGRACVKWARGLAK